MRVVSGYLGGRNFASPKGHRTHPMSDKVRGGLFGVLGDIKGLSALDVFSGSGALGIEAISRGAKSVTAIDSDKSAHEVILENIKSLNITDRIRVTRAYFNSWSTRNEKQKFDLIFADPPYDKIPYRDIKKLAIHLNDKGTLVISLPSSLEPLKLIGLEIALIKNYGDAQLVFYKKIS
jgi:16S rRNA (guanine966-N2)-methyltransferase